MAQELNAGADKKPFTLIENKILHHVIALPGMRRNTSGSFNWDLVATRYTYVAKLNKCHNKGIVLYHRNRQQLEERMKTMRSNSIK